MAKYEGGCLCGAVRYKAEVEPVNERVCHCRICQRAIGAAFNARLLFRIDDVTVEGPVATINSTPDLKRCFCPVCGTTASATSWLKGCTGSKPPSGSARPRSTPISCRPSATDPERPAAASPLAMAFHQRFLIDAAAPAVRA